MRHRLYCAVREAWQFTLAGDDVLPPAPLDQLLIAALRLEQMWLFRQLVLGLAVLIEDLFVRAGFTNNPLDRPTTLHRRRVDGSLLDDLALGRGTTGSEVAMLPPRHAVPFIAF